MPFATVTESPLIPGASPVTIHYREVGDGLPLIFLHGGWGYEIYSFQKQAEAFADSHRIIIPDRTGYGRSMRTNGMPPDFHSRAAVEMIRFLDALEIKRAILWGHSDGAVISVMMGLADEGRFAGIILEAFHFYRSKPGSEPFFLTMANDPTKLGERVTQVLASEHGEDYWQKLIVNNGYAWLKIAEESRREEEDLYGGRLGELSVPTILIHGSRDPRTEPDEIESVRSAIPQAKIFMIEGGGHSPHSESNAVAETNKIAGEFLRSIRETEKPV